MLNLAVHATIQNLGVETIETDEDVVCSDLPGSARSWRSLSASPPGRRTARTVSLSDCRDARQGFQN